MSGRRCTDRTWLLVPTLAARLVYAAGLVALARRVSGELAVLLLAEALHWLTLANLQRDCAFLYERRFEVVWIASELALAAWVLLLWAAPGLTGAAIAVATAALAMVFVDTAATGDHIAALPWVTAYVVFQSVGLIGVR
uniref:Uncharacterized protein n=1 Tax=viral metagenome TaxID=1070528 RepID=A0A6C0KCE2_9ZZZZ